MWHSEKTLKIGYIKTLELPNVLENRSTIVVVDNKGDTKGYITEKQLAISLSKNSHRDSKKTL